MRFLKAGRGREGNIVYVDNCEQNMWDERNEIINRSKLMIQIQNTVVVTGEGGKEGVGYGLNLTQA